jgi:hypothetical protein
LRVEVFQVLHPDGLEAQLELNDALATVAMGKHKEIVEQDTLVELLDVLEEYLTLLHQVTISRVKILGGREGGGREGGGRREGERKNHHIYNVHQEPSINL